MASLADHIERYLREQLAAAEDGVLEVQRGDLSALFQCAPSQINYVLETRFTFERGYLVQSRRGGGGFIRLIRLASPSPGYVLEMIDRHVGERIGQERAECLVRGLAEAGVLSGREEALILAAMNRQVLDLPLPKRDEVRSRLLKAMLLSLLRREAAEGDVGNAMR